MRRKLRLCAKTLAVSLGKWALDAADVLLKLADRLADDTDSIGATATEAAPISRAAVEEALDVVRVRASVELSGFPPEVADVFLAAKVSPAAVDRMLVAALQRVQ